MDLDITHRAFSQLYDTLSTNFKFLEASLTQVNPDLNLKGLESSAFKGFLDSFELMSKLALFSRQIAKYEEFLFRYFGKGSEKMGYNDAVFALGHLLNTINLNLTSKDVQSFIEDHYPKKLSFRMEQATLLLGVEK